jgi:tryptophan synthase alpha chain
MKRRATRYPRPFKRRSPKADRHWWAFSPPDFRPRLGFKDNLAAVADVCDVVEIGVPFSDPMADGTTIQRASFAALADGVTLPWILDELRSVQPRHAAPILLMSYLNPLLSVGLDALPRAAASAGVAGFIVPDLPFEESADLKRALDREGSGLVQMVTPVTPPERLADAVPGGAGLRLRGDHDGHHRQRAKSECRTRCSTTWIGSSAVAGAGVRRLRHSLPRQVARFAAHVDGVVVGSALVEVPGARRRSEALSCARCAK